VSPSHRIGSPLYSRRVASRCRRAASPSRRHCVASRRGRVAACSGRFASRRGCVGPRRGRVALRPRRAAVAVASGGGLKRSRIECGTGAGMGAGGRQTSIPGGFTSIPGDFNSIPGDFFFSTTRGGPQIMWSPLRYAKFNLAGRVFLFINRHSWKQGFPG
jgi:hypothetical protein